MAELYEMGDRRDYGHRDAASRRQETRQAILPIRAVTIMAAIAAAGSWYLGNIPGSNMPEQQDYELVSLSFQPCDDRVLNDCVIDGGHFVYKGQNFAIGDVATPSVTSPACPAEATLGLRNREQLLALLNGGAFEMRADIRPTDTAGRKLRLLSRDGVSLGQLLIGQGVARPAGAPARWCDRPAKPTAQ